MKEVCWTACCLPIIRVTVDFGFAKHPVSDQSSKQDGCDTRTKTHRPDLIVEEHERENQCRWIQRRCGDHQSERWPKTRGTLVHAGKDWRYATRTEHQWRAHESRNGL